MARKPKSPSLLTDAAQTAPVNPQGEANPGISSSNEMAQIVEPDLAEKRMAENPVRDVPSQENQTIQEAHFKDEPTPIAPIASIAPKSTAPPYARVAALALFAGAIGGGATTLLLPYFLPPSTQIQNKESASSQTAPALSEAAQKTQAEKLANLETALRAEIERISTQISTLRQGDIKNAQTSSGQGSSINTGDSSRLTALEANLSTLKESVTTLEQASRAHIRFTNASARFAGIDALLETFEKGQPLAGAVASLKTLGFPQEQFTPLAPFMAQGAPTPKMLVAELTAARAAFAKKAHENTAQAPKQQEAEATGQQKMAQSWGDQAWASITTLFTNMQEKAVSLIDIRTTNKAAPKIEPSKIETALILNDYGAALAGFDALPEQERKALAGLRLQLEASLKARQTILALLNETKTSLNANPPPAP